jgi:hypothetical protein
MWFEKPTNDHVNSTFPYKSWKDFTEYKPHKLWKPYILSSWSWKKFNTGDLTPQELKKQLDQQNNLLDTGSIHISHYSKEQANQATYDRNVEMLQIVFISPDRFSGLHRVEVCVKEEDENAVRQWLMSHMPTFWKL